MYPWLQVALSWRDVGAQQSSPGLLQYLRKMILLIRRLHTHTDDVCAFLSCLMLVDGGQVLALVRAPPTSLALYKKRDHEGADSISTDDPTKHEGFDPRPESERGVS